MTSCIFGSITNPLLLQFKLIWNSCSLKLFGGWGWRETVSFINRVNIWFLECCLGKQNQITCQMQKGWFSLFQKCVHWYLQLWSEWIFEILDEAPVVIQKLVSKAREEQRMCRLKEFDSSILIKLCSIVRRSGGICLKLLEKDNYSWNLFSSFEDLFIATQNFHKFCIRDEQR